MCALKGLFGYIFGFGISGFGFWVLGLEVEDDEMGLVYALVLMVKEDVSCGSVVLS